LINIHWDGGWLQPINDGRAKVETKFKKYWTQIASNFKNVDDGVIFAGTNEVHIEGNYGAPTAENAAVQNGFNQLFVDTVRKTGGRNSRRWLAVQTYNTDIDHGVKHNLKMPKDSVKGKLMMEVHFYSPYNFTLNEKSDIWQWGAKATDKKATDTWGNEDHVDAQFKKMKVNFIAKGVPVLLGEYGTGRKPKFPGMDKYRALWTEYVTKSAIKHGMVPMYWDTGTADGVINRSTGAKQNTNLLNALMKGAKS
ncbi:MAG TPA: cellulase family glycosylhydrolase, partial [Fimbriimonas sp.]|nr:cellulase family glycosylhydrolase [Fimbriimonas sp.]